MTRKWLGMFLAIVGLVTFSTGHVAMAAFIWVVTLIVYGTGTA
jgi:hypothetical protein